MKWITLFYFYSLGKRGKNIVIKLGSRFLFRKFLHVMDVRVSVLTQYNSITILFFSLKLNAGL